MYRGTTPTLQVRVTGVDVSELSGIYLTIRQGDAEITKGRDDIILESGNTISARLSQEDTLRFAKGHAWVQLRATTKGGLALASEIKVLPVEEILKDGVIP